MPQMPVEQCAKIADAQTGRQEINCDLILRASKGACGRPFLFFKLTWNIFAIGI